MTETGPLVSVLLPTFRRPKELRKAIESIVCQTYANLEIIISNNDRENEETNAICLEYAGKDARIHYHMQPVNLGMGGNVNFLINAASGDYCLNMSDDDWLDKDFVRLLLKTLRSDPKCVAAHGDYVLYDGKGQPRETFSMDDNICENYRDRILAVATGNLPTHGMHETQLLKKCMFHDPAEKIRYGEDWIFWTKMAFLGNIRTARGATYHKLYGAEHNVEHYGVLFDSRDVRKENQDEQVIVNILDSIVYDSFYNDKLDRNGRLLLAMYISSRAYPGLIVGIKKLFRFLWRHPLAFRNREFTAMFTVHKR